MERLFIAVLAAAILVFIAAGASADDRRHDPRQHPCGDGLALDQREALATISNGKRECL